MWRGRERERDTERQRGKERRIGEEKGFVRNPCVLEGASRNMDDASSGRGGEEPLHPWCAVFAAPGA